MSYESSTAVSFDIWKTLIKSHPEQKPARNSIVADRFDVDIETVKLAMRQADVTCDRITDTTGMQLGPIERLEKVADLLKTPLGKKAIHALADELQEQFLEYPVGLQEEELLTTLDAISENQLIALTSNTGFYDGNYMRQALDAVGILERTDVQTFSNEVAVAKPRPEIFAYTATQLGLSPDAVTHVGDNHDADYRGALAAGMKAVHIAETAKDDSTITASTIKEAHERGLL